MEESKRVSRAVPSSVGAILVGLMLGASTALAQGEPTEEADPTLEQGLPEGGDQAEAPEAPPAETMEESSPREAPPEPEANADEAEEEPIAGYKKGFFIQAPDAPFKLRINGRVQARYDLEILENAADESAFTIRRARFAMSGHAFTKALKYKFQMDLSRGSVSLKDFFLDYKLVPDWLHLRVGQWKRPFSRQQINSSSRFELIDRAITNKFFAAGRDIGLAIHNDYEKSPEFEYALGLFNGSGDGAKLSGDVVVDPATGEGKITKGKFSNVPDRLHPAIVMRVGYNHGGIKGYSEADLEGGDFRFAVGASAIADFDADNDNESAVRGELDYALKIHGFSSNGAVYVSSNQNGASFSDQSYEAVGFHMQAGYVIAERFQPAVRYAIIAPDAADSNQQEIMGGLSYYIFEHNVKTQLDGGALISDDPAGKETAILLRAQVQLGF